MAENYEEGKDYLLPVKVSYPGLDEWPVKIIYNDGKDKNCHTYIRDEPGLLVTESEVAALVRHRINKERDDRLAELEKENADLKEQIYLLKDEVGDWRSKYVSTKVINLTLAEKIEDLKGKNNG